MKDILEYPLRENQAALWFLGQAGYVIRAGRTTVVLDPYLSDSVGRQSPEYARAFPVPLDPARLTADLFVVTHDHADHLDPETLAAYSRKRETMFVAPRFACGKLAALGVPEANIVRIDVGEERRVKDVFIRGILTVPTDPGVADTAGYRLRFANGRSVYHSSDTSFSPQLLESAPRAEVLLVCINGKWGNLNVAEAVALAVRVRPSVAIPNHYDVMRLNSADPEAFARRLREEAPDIEANVLSVMTPWLWPGKDKP